jgi:mitochondrial enoyl-[acyl-carrier protein] reductase / trans-2-enoyl-CoA reductase
LIVWVAEVAAFGPPETAVRLVEQPEPGEPGADEVVVAAELAPINPSDLLNIEGRYGAHRPPLPLIPGGEGVGRVV